MYFLPILLALLVCAFVGISICFMDGVEQRAKFKGRSDEEQEARIAFQEEKRRDAINYVSYRYRRQ